MATAENYRLPKQLRAVGVPLQTMGFLTILSVMQFWYFINYKEEGFSQSVALIYILIPVVLLAYSMLGKAVLEELKLIYTLIFAFLGFVAAWAFTLIVLGSYLGMSFGTIATTAVSGTIVMQCLFVAPSEELAFRFILPQYLKSKFRTHLKWLALIIPQVSFALFHFGVYSGDWTNMAISFLFGCTLMVLYGCKFLGERLGLGFCIGAHAAYNLVLLGVLSGGFVTLIGGA
jgi:hypothetical protein